MDSEQMRRNFESNAAMIAAEPAYILLAAAGHPDAHEAVRRLTLEAQRTGRPFVELLENSEELAPYLAKFTGPQWTLLRDPSLYTGIAAQKTVEVCEMWEKRLEIA